MSRRILCIRAAIAVVVVVLAVVAVLWLARESACPFCPPLEHERIMPGELWAMGCPGAY